MCRLRWFVVSVVFLVLFIPVVLLVNNNVSFHRTSPDDFVRQLDTATHRGTRWLVVNRRWIDSLSNVFLFYMINDMAEISGDPAPRQIAGDYLELSPKKYFWRRLIDGNENGPLAFSSNALDSRCDYCRWIAYGVAPHEVQLTSIDRSNMFSPTRYVWGSRTHQLLSLLIYRQRNGSSPELDRLIDHLCEGIAREESWDVRVSDLYLQRVAFILAAGRPDLIKRRWVERILDSQQADGGWMESWHGWGPGLFQFYGTSKLTHPHPSVQGVWLLYLLKYRYPGWVQQHY